MRDASTQVLRARFRLMLDHPFLATAVARLPLAEVDAVQVPTMATDGYRIYYSQGFVESLSADECVGVLAHELLHCVFGHIERRGDRDPLLWNVAIDFATNHCLNSAGFVLPKGALLQARYSSNTAEEIYDLLEPEILKYAKGFDLHLSPNDPRVRAHCRPEDPTSNELRDLRHTLVREMGGSTRGSLPAQWTQELQRADSHLVPWQDLLSRFIGATVHNDFRLYPPNKRHIWQGLYLPSLGGLGPRQFVVAIDTSGSMSKDNLAIILGEIDSFRAIASCELRLIQADAAIASDMRFDPWDLSYVDLGPAKVVGRGGTDFRPVFESVAEEAVVKGYLPDCLIYFTDGFGSFPKEAPSYPVLWIVVEEGIEEFPFGEVLCLPKSYLSR